MNEKPIYFVKYGQRRKGKKCICKFCKKEFIGKFNNPPKYCSSQCYMSDIQNNVDLECSNCGKKFKRMKCKLKCSKHGVYFCSRKCKDMTQRINSTNPNADKMRPAHYGTSKTAYATVCRRIQNNICVGCGATEEYLLIIHHIDGNRKNNPLDGSNWEIVCRNCHAKRHLQLKNNKWTYSSYSLTPKNILKKL